MLVGVRGLAALVVDRVAAQDAHAQPQRGVHLAAAREPAEIHVERVQRLGVLAERPVEQHGDRVERVRRLGAERRRRVRLLLELGDLLGGVGLAVDVRIELDRHLADRLLQVDVRIRRADRRVRDLLAKDGLGFRHVHRARMRVRSGRRDRHVIAQRDLRRGRCGRHDGDGLDFGRRDRDQPVTRPLVTRGDLLALALPRDRDLALGDASRRRATRRRS